MLEIGIALAAMALLILVIIVRAFKRAGHLKKEYQTVKNMPLTPIKHLTPQPGTIALQGEVQPGKTVKDPVTNEDVAYFSINIDRKVVTNSGEPRPRYKTALEEFDGGPLVINDQTASASIDMQKAIYYLNYALPETYLLKKHFYQNETKSDQLPDAIKDYLQSKKIKLRGGMGLGPHRVFRVRRFCVKPGDQLLAAGQPTVETTSRDGIYVRFGHGKKKSDTYVTDQNKDTLAETILRRARSSKASAIALTVLETLLLAGAAALIAMGAG